MQACLYVYPKLSDLARRLAFLVDFLWCPAVGKRGGIHHSVDEQSFSYGACRP